MVAYQNRRWLVEPPHAATFVLMTANIFVFALCLRHANGLVISSEVLFLNGAMYSRAFDQHEYWRLITHGFLHADLLHLATNMLCLVLWGGLLERRVGAFYFLLIYLGAMISGAIVSDLHHAGPYLLVGASGAISGILGALMCLWILGRIDLSASFFLMNIGLNVVLAMSSRRIDWAAHVGGFGAGLIICALIDAIERVNRFALRCKFPEFVKINAFVLVALLGTFVWSTMRVAPYPASAEAWLLLLACAAVCLAVIKLIDLVLSVRRGLAIIVAGFSVANAALILLAARMAVSVPALNCAAPPYQAGRLVEALADLACWNRQLTIGIIAALTGAATLVLYSHQLARGLADVGFVGPSLRAERKRRLGI